MRRRKIDTLEGTIYLGRSQTSCRPSSRVGAFGVRCRKVDSGPNVPVLPKAMARRTLNESELRSEPSCCLRNVVVANSNSLEFGALEHQPKRRLDRGPAVTEFASIVYRDGLATAGDPEAFNVELAVPARLECGVQHVRARY